MSVLLPLLDSLKGVTLDVAQTGLQISGDPYALKVRESAADCAPTTITHTHHHTHTHTHTHTRTPPLCVVKDIRSRLESTGGPADPTAVQMTFPCAIDDSRANATFRSGLSM